MNCLDKADSTYEFRNGAATQTVEGEYHFREYRAPETASTAQLERNYITALRNAGYAIVFEAQFHDSFVGHMGKTWIRISIRSDGGDSGTLIRLILKTRQTISKPKANAYECGASVDRRRACTVDGGDQGGLGQTELDSAHLTPRLGGIAEQSFLMGIGRQFELQFQFHLCWGRRRFGDAVLGGD